MNDSIAILMSIIMIIVWLCVVWFDVKEEIAFKDDVIQRIEALEAK